MPTDGSPGLDLQQLREISLPDPVSWTPRTVGWYVVFGLAAVVASRLIWIAYCRYRSNAYRRAALAELSVIEQAVRLGRRRDEALATLPSLLKRTALAGYPRSEVAGLSGPAWLAFLDQTMRGSGFAIGEGCRVSELAYAPRNRVAQISDESLTALLRLARRWIAHHRT